MSPVSISTSTSATYAEKEYAGARPAAAPLCTPPIGGVLYAPLAINAPLSSCDLCNASRYETPIAGSLLLYILRSLSTKYSAGISNIPLAAFSNSSRISSAALIAALAFMNVTRDEYDPKSTGLVSLSWERT